TSSMMTKRMLGVAGWGGSLSSQSLESQAVSAAPNVTSAVRFRRLCFTGVLHSSSLFRPLLQQGVAGVLCCQFRAQGFHLCPITFRAQIADQSKANATLGRSLP